MTQSTNTFKTCLHGAIISAIFLTATNELHRIHRISHCATVTTSPTRTQPIKAHSHGVFFVSATACIF